MVGLLENDLRLAGLGVKALLPASLAALGEMSDLVITMLPSSPHVEAVYTGDGGVLAAARPVAS